MKLAVCYSGEARDIHSTYENHVRYIYQDHDVHIFIHTWESDGTTKTNPFKERGGWHSDISLFSTDEYVRRFRPYKLKIEKQSIACQDHRERRIAMFYGILQSYKLIDNPEQYDMVVRIRSDAVFDSPFQFESMRDRNTVYIPRLPDGFNVGWQPGDWDPEKYCPDFFACGSPGVMKAYAEYATSTECLTDTTHVEWSLCAYIHTRSIRISKVSNVCCLHRFNVLT